MGAVSSMAFRMPRPTYAFVANGAGLAFADGWTPQHALARHSSPIVIETRGLPGARAAESMSGPSLQARVSLLKTSQGHSIGALHVFHPLPASRLTILFSHGTSFDLGMIRDHCVQLANFLDVDVFAYDYTGYGPNTDTPSESAACADADAALAAVLQAGVPVNRVVFYGLSLGSAFAMHQAASPAGGACAGLIIRSGFLSGGGVVGGRAGAVIGSVWPFTLLDNGPRAAAVSAPALVIHGHGDELIGPWQAHALVARLQGAVAPLYLPGSGHFDVERSPLYLPRLDQFLRHEVRGLAARGPSDRGGGGSGISR